MTQHLGLPGGNWKQKPNVESGYERELDKKIYYPSDPQLLG